LTGTPVTAPARAVAPDSTVSGRFARLSDAASQPPQEIADLLATAALSPEMATPRVFSTVPVGSRFGHASLVTGVSSGELLGLITNVEAEHYPGVAVLTIFMDRRRAKPVASMEAWGLYVARMFSLGARKVQMDALEFNGEVHSLMGKIGATVEGVRRQHCYIAGRFWDVVVYGFTSRMWDDVARHYSTLYRGSPAWEVFATER